MINEGTNDRCNIIDHSRDAATLDISAISVGDVFSIEHRFVSDDVDDFAKLCGDFSPLHIDDKYASATEFGGRVVHGMFLASLFSTLVGMKIPGQRALYIGQELNFRRSVIIGETVTALAKVAAVNTSLGVIQLTMMIQKADGSVAVNGTGKVRIRDSATPSEAQNEVTPGGAPAGTPVALVTGAARGIGAAIARRLARDGFAIIINYRSSRASAERVAKEIRASSGTAHTIRADLQDDVALDAMVSEITAKFGRLDLLVNNAAPGYEKKSVEELTWENVMLQIDTSVRAPLILSRAFLPLLRESCGAIVNIISQVVENAPPPHMLDYVLGKYGLLGLTRGLSAEWAADGVRVNGVAPSLVETNMTSHFKDRVFKLEASRTPLRRIAAAEDVAAAVSYLGGKDASFLTGLVVSVSGGQIMK